MSRVCPSENTGLFPACRARLRPDQWTLFHRAWEESGDVEAATAALEAPLVPDFLGDLARAEAAWLRVRTAKGGPTGEPPTRIVNPTLEIVDCRWRGLLPLVTDPDNPTLPQPTPGDEVLLFWRTPATGRLGKRVATKADLLALKTVVEGRDPAAIARAHNRPVGVVDDALGFAVQRGLLLGPPSRIRRDPILFGTNARVGVDYLSSPVFTIQWHVTQACDLACRHCYDRSRRSPLSRDDGLRILDDLRRFCLDRNVWGQVSFSGGNPFLYSHFFELYEAAVERGFTTAVLGNPVPAEQLDRLLAVRRPAFYQISLEGLGPHNDTIRGSGHFERAVAFLEQLRRREIFSMVMLTLTRDNLDQVIPLGEFLQGKTDLFTFNRLSMVGEGARLQGAPVAAYEKFLRDYVAAARTHPVFRLKDNLINILKHREEQPVFGGCAGYGCGAAFNFVSILPDGEVHACRKFPSAIGNILERSLGAIYDSAEAARYRGGSSSCGACAVRPVCGGCLAVAYGHGLDVFTDRDPYCFFDDGMH